ncbi:MAG TPA: dihydrodipicolinate synthase family protein [Devosiaceae bacterium]|jgi:4-hydroxy-tetrahydrodipicolinate synthase
MAASIPLICRTATVFSPVDGSFDENAQRQFLQQFVGSRHGIYVGSAGSGESHSLTMDELKILYRAAVAECKGKIPVYANPPEQHTPAKTLEHSLLAAEAGVEVVNLYGPSSWHGYKPTDDELLAFFDEVLKDFNHPAAIAPNPVIGYTPSPAIVAKIVKQHPQIVAINLAGLGDNYFIELQRALTRDVAIYVPYGSSIETLTMGAAGLLGAEANIIPKTYRLYLDHVANGDFAAATEAYADLHRVTDYTKPWHRASPRWIKMFLKAFKCPGGEGGLRRPYSLPGDAEIQRFAQGLVALDVPEINELAATAGIA